MKLTELIKKTAGGKHGWYMTDLGFKVRKPLKNYDFAPKYDIIQEPEEITLPQEKTPSWISLAITKVIATIQEWWERITTP